MRAHDIGGSAPAELGDDEIKWKFVGDEVMCHVCSDTMDLSEARANTFEGQPYCSNCWKDIRPLDHLKRLDETEEEFRIRQGARPLCHKCGEPANLDIKEMQRGKELYFCRTCWQEVFGSTAEKERDKLHSLSQTPKYTPASNKANLSRPRTSQWLASLDDGPELSPTLISEIPAQDLRNILMIAREFGEVKFAIQELMVQRLDGSGSYSLLSERLRRIEDQVSRPGPFTKEVLKTQEQLKMDVRELRGLLGGLRDILSDQQRRMTDMEEKWAANAKRSDSEMLKRLTALDIKGDEALRAAAVENSKLKEALLSRCSPSMIPESIDPMIAVWVVKEGQTFSYYTNPGDARSHVHDYILDLEVDDETAFNIGYHCEEMRRSHYEALVTEQQGG